MQICPEKGNPGVPAPGFSRNHRSPEENTPSPNAAQDYVRALLIREFLIEQANIMGSLAISFAEAEWRGSDVLAGIHLDQIRLVGRELVRSFAELSRISRGVQ